VSLAVIQRSLIEYHALPNVFWAMLLTNLSGSKEDEMSHLFYCIVPDICVELVNSKLFKWREREDRGVFQIKWVENNIRISLPNGNSDNSVLFTVSFKRYIIMCGNVTVN
jgi:hypothetical protein